MYLILVQALDLLKSLTGLFPFCWANGRLLRLDLSILFWLALSRWKSSSIYSVDFTSCGGNQLSDLQCNWCRFSRQFLITTQFTLCKIFWSFFHIILYMDLFMTLVFHSQRRYIDFVYIRIYTFCICLTFRVRGGVWALSVRASVRGIWVDLDTDLRFTSRS